MQKHKNTSIVNLYKQKQTIDFFPNWQNSAQTAKWQMIGHALLSAKFNILQSHLPSWSCGRVLAHKLEVRGSNPIRDVCSLIHLTFPFPDAYENDCWFRIGMASHFINIFSPCLCFLYKTECYQRLKPVKHTLTFHKNCVVFCQMTFKLNWDTRSFYIHFTFAFGI